MFRVYRKIGAGDVEHVRSQLLQVAAMDPTHIVEQAVSAYNLGDELGMMTRLHVNLDALDEKQKQALLNVFYSRQNHQLEPWQGRSHDFLARKLEGCELVIEGAATTFRLRKTVQQASIEADVSGLLTALRQVWTNSGGRFLQGNFPRVTQLDLLSSYPELGSTYL